MSDMSENRKFKFTQLTIEPWGQASLHKLPIESKEDFLKVMESVWDQYLQSGLGEDCHDADEEFEHDPNYWHLEVTTTPRPV